MELIVQVVGITLKFKMKLFRIMRIMKIIKELLELLA